MKPNIVISSHDLDRLESLLDHLPSSMADSKAALLEELTRAQILEPEEIAPTVVLIGSRVRFAVEPSGEEFSATLSYPEDLNGGPERISVLSPVGMALLGLSVGDRIDWPGPNGSALRVRVLDVLCQPRDGVASLTTEARR